MQTEVIHQTWKIQICPGKCFHSTINQIGDRDVSVKKQTNKQPLLS